MVSDRTQWQKEPKITEGEGDSQQTDIRVKKDNDVTEELVKYLIKSLPEINWKYKMHLINL